MLGWLVLARDGKKLGPSWDSVNSIPTLSQPGPFQTFAGWDGSDCGRRILWCSECGGDGFL